MAAASHQLSSVLAEAGSEKPSNASMSSNESTTVDAYRCSRYLYSDKYEAGTRGSARSQRGMVLPDSSTGLTRRRHAAKSIAIPLLAQTGMVPSYAEAQAA